MKPLDVGMRGGVEAWRRGGVETGIRNSSFHAKRVVRILEVASGALLTHENKSLLTK
jgi:hypothetical protein